MKEYKEYLEIFCSAIVAGICICIGCWVNLHVGDIAGAILFSFGLITVVHYQLNLFTGKAGFFESKDDLVKLFTVILFGNFAGCYLMACFSEYQTNLQDLAQIIVNKRIELGGWGNFYLAIPCGFIMTTAVQFAKQGKYLPLLFGVPVFILCGFIHCIADIGYYCLAQVFYPLLWLCTVAGNFIGCNLYRLITGDYHYINKYLNNYE